MRISTSGRMACHTNTCCLSFSPFYPSVQVVEKLPDDHKGLFRANVVAQLEMQLYNLGLVDRDVRLKHNPLIVIQFKNGKTRLVIICCFSGVLALLAVVEPVVNG